MLLRRSALAKWRHFGVSRHDERVEDLPRVYQTGEVAARLGVSTVTVRKYADALEAVTGRELTRQRRARVFTADDLEAFERAQAAAAAAPGITVEEAMQRALGRDAAAVVPTDQGGAGEVPEVPALLRAIVGQLEAQAEELRELRAAVARLEVAQALPAPEPTGDAEPRESSVRVPLSRWLARLVRRRR